MSQLKIGKEIPIYFYQQCSEYKDHFYASRMEFLGIYFLFCLSVAL